MLVERRLNDPAHGPLPAFQSHCCPREAFEEKTMGGGHRGRGGKNLAIIHSLKNNCGAPTIMGYGEYFLRDTNLGAPG